MKNKPRGRGLESMLLLGILAILGGCGYTTHSLLQGSAQKIYVDNFVNEIDVAEESSDARVYRGYRHGLEADITRAVMDKFIYDGSLKVVGEENADLVLTGKLLDFKKEGLRYDKADNIEEYRIRLIVDIELKDRRSDKTLWREKDFAGEDTYRTTGSLAKSEGSALDDAVDDLARRIVERTVEEW